MEHLGVVFELLYITGCKGPPPRRGAWSGHRRYLSIITDNYRTRNLYSPQDKKINLHHFSYLFLIIFTLGALVIAEAYKNKRIIRKYESLLLILMLLGAAGSSSEYFALRWHLWTFTAAKSFNIVFGAEVETYIYGILATLLIAIITLASLTTIDRRNTRLRKSKLRKVSLAAGAARR
jgi:hypothetical protein